MAECGKEGIDYEEDLTYQYLVDDINVDLEKAIKMMSIDNE